MTTTPSKRDSEINLKQPHVLRILKKIGKSPSDLLNYLRKLGSTAVDAYCQLVVKGVGQLQLWHTEENLEARGRILEETLGTEIADPYYQSLLRENEEQLEAARRQAPYRISHIR